MPRISGAVTRLGHFQQIFRRATIVSSGAQSPDATAAANLAAPPAIVHAIDSGFTIRPP
jgi:hypothetical protein